MPLQAEQSTDLKTDLIYKTSKEQPSDAESDGCSFTDYS